MPWAARHPVTQAMRGMSPSHPCHARHVTQSPMPCTACHENICEWFKTLSELNFVIEVIRDVICTYDRHMRDKSLLSPVWSLDLTLLVYLASHCQIECLTASTLQAAVMAGYVCVCYGKYRNGYSELNKCFYNCEYIELTWNTCDFDAVPFNNCSVCVQF